MTTIDPRLADELARFEPACAAVDLDPVWVLNELTAALEAQHKPYSPDETKGTPSQNQFD